jgi:hypothetical protein
VSVCHGLETMYESLVVDDWFKGVLVDCQPLVMYTAHIIEIDESAYVGV